MQSPVWEDFQLCKHNASSPLDIACHWLTFYSSNRDATASTSNGQINGWLRNELFLCIWYIARNIQMFSFFIEILRGKRCLKKINDRSIRLSINVLINNCHPSYRWMDGWTSVATTAWHFCRNPVGPQASLCSLITVVDKVSVAAFRLELRKT